ncbi:hypothetical protein L218DRAFT_707583 [Marasmius fiardii PR-910]|nr:hypothetical protein L218DRAFT_707583 [Marasmius fiardii PR-910]
MSNSSSSTTQILNGASKVNIETSTFSTVGRNQYNSYHTHQTIIQNQSQATVLNSRAMTVIGAMSGGAQVISCLLYIFEHERTGKLCKEGIAITSRNGALKDLKIRVESTVDVLIKYHDAIVLIEDEEATKHFKELFVSFQEFLVEIKGLVEALEHRSSHRILRTIVQNLQPFRRKASAKVFILRAQFIKLQGRVNEGSQKAIARKDLLVVQDATYASQDLNDVMKDEIPRLKGLSDREIRLELTKIAVDYLPSREEARLFATRCFDKYFKTGAYSVVNIFIHHKC